MAKLIATSPFLALGGQPRIPQTIGGVTLREIEPGRMTLIAPFQGGIAATSEALEKAFGFAFPAPNRCLGTGPFALWWGLEQALLIGAACPDLPQAACTDQSDGWAILRIEGAAAEAVLARLVPIDLRASAFQPGKTARTLIGHMHGSVTRSRKDAFDLMVMRSMAETLLQEVEKAAEFVAGRETLAQANA